MTRALVFALPLGLLAACAPSTEDLMARGAAQSVTSRAALKLLPAGAPVAGYTDCVIQNASSQQILTLAADSLIGPTASTYEVLAQITDKPETRQCLTDIGIPAPVAG